MKKAEWLNRTLVVGEHYIALCLSEAAYQKELKNLKVNPASWDHWNKGPGFAGTHTFTMPNGRNVALVTIDPEPEHTGCQIAAMLCHEAVHVFQYNMEAIGEVSPSKEFMAYSIQHIAQELMQSFMRQRAAA